MLRGTADLALLAKRAPTIAGYPNHDVPLQDVLSFQLTAEMRNSAREALLPPALHPTIPAALSLQAWQVNESPWGAFAAVFIRASCRSGVRARGFCVGAVASTEAAAAALGGQYAFLIRVADIHLQRGYDGVRLRVRDGDTDILQVSAIDPDPMGADDVQYTDTLNLAHTPHGLRLVQLEIDRHAARVERLTPHIITWDGAALGNQLLQPARAVSASVAVEQIVLKPVRFVCKADELAFTGTESVR